MRTPAHIPAIMLALLLSLPCTGQAANAGRPATNPGIADAELEQVTIEARIRQIEAGSDKPLAIQAELLNLYKQALDQLRVSSTWAEQVDRLEQLRQQIPVELGRLKARLAVATSRSATQSEVYIPPDLTLEELNRTLQEATADLKGKQQTLDSAEDVLSASSNRRSSLPQRIADSTAALARVNQDLDAAPAAGTDPDLAAARRTLLLARRRALPLEIRAYELELDSYDSMGTDLLIARRDVARLEVAGSQAKVARVTAAVNRKRLDDIERQRKEAEQEVARMPEALRELAHVNEQLVRERQSVNAEIDEAALKMKAVEATVDRLDVDLRALQEKLRVAGMVADIGPLLGREKSQLPDLVNSARDIRSVKHKIAKAQVRLLDLHEERDQIADLDARVAETTKALRESRPDEDTTAIAPEIKRILQIRLEAIDSLRKDHETYWNGLIGLNLALTRLVTRTQAFLDFINENVFWLPSDPVLTRAKLPEHLMPPADAWPALGDALCLDAIEHPAVYAVFFLLLAVWVGVYPKVRKHRAEIDRRVNHVYADSFGLTLRALLIDLFMASPAPATLWFVGQRLDLAVSFERAVAADFIIATALALQSTAMPLFVVLLLLGLFRRGGVAECHFQWSPRVIAILRANLRWFTVLGVPLTLVAWFARGHADARWGSSVGRGAFLLLTVLLATFAHRVLHPRSGVLASEGRSDETWRQPALRRFWHLVGVVVPLALGLASAIGYYFTAAELARRLVRTLWIVTALLALRAVIARAAIASGRRMALRKAKEEHAAGGNPAGDGPVHARAGAAIAENVSEEIGARTRTLLRWLVACGLLVGIWGIWQDVVPAFSFVGRVELWSYTVDAPSQAATGIGTTSGGATERITVPVHLADLLLALIFVAATVALATNGPNVVEMLLLARLPLDPGSRFAVAAVLRYVIVVGGLVLAFGTIGIRWSQVQWLAAAVTVGLGFGLQEIFANFVSGLILLFERPIRIGDTVTVGEISGTVSRIQIRATTIMGWDRKELIIPNKEFVTGKVVNWTLSDSVLRLVIRVGIAYGSDTEQAQALLRKVAHDHPLVLDRPEPLVLFDEFGDSALNFELRVFVGNINHLVHVRHELHLAIDREFRQAGIEIAFPQQDVHIRSMPDDLWSAKRRPDVGSATPSASATPEVQARGDGRQEH